MTVNMQEFVNGVAEKYPKELLQNRLTVEGNIIAIIFKEPSIYNDLGSDISQDVMLTKSGRFLFSIISLLKEKGYSVFDEVTILSELSETLRDKFEGFGGWRSIQKLTSIVDLSNSDVIIDEFNKSNTLIKLYDSGFNLNKEIITSKGIKTTPIKLFANWDTQSVLNWYEEKIAGCGVSVRSDLITDEGLLNFDDDFIKRLQRGEQRGVSIATAGKDIDGNLIYTFPYLDSSIGGFKPGTLNAIGGTSGTGKSTLMLNIIMSLASQGTKVLIINNEMTKDDYQCMLLGWVLYKVFHYHNLTRKKMADGIFSDEDLEMVKKANSYYEKVYGKNIKIVTLSDADMDLSMQIAKKEIVRNGYTCIVVDTFKLTISSDSKDNFWMKLVEDSRKYNKLCAGYNVIGLMTIQLAISSSSGQLFLDASSLSNSKQIKEVLSTLLLMRKLQPYERETGSPYDIRAFRHKKNAEGKWEKVDYPLDQDNNYSVLFVDKNRRGVDSGSDGVAFLLKQRLDYSVYSESAKCYPAHKKAVDAQ